MSALDLARQELRVEFVRTDEIHNKGRVHELYVENILIGRLYREYTEGSRPPNNFKGAWDWYFELDQPLSSYVENHDCFFMDKTDWHLLSDAKERITQEMDQPLLGPWEDQVAEKGREFLHLAAQPSQRD